MNAIIVGPNGRPSILEMVRTYDFNELFYVFTYKRLRNGTTSWRKYVSDNKIESVILMKNPPSFGKGDKVIMWGTRVQIELGEAIVYNHPNVSNNASNKKTARLIFEEKGIAAPKLVKREFLYKCSYPLIIRRDRHRAGIGFNIANNDVEALGFIDKMHNDEYYMSEIYPKTAEFRVHCAMGKALLVKQKPTPEDKYIVAWNFHQVEEAWTTINRKDYNFEMIKLALDAITALEIDYGAVDIMSYPSKKGFPDHVVAEVNTAPSFTPYLIEKYGAFFDKIFRTEGKIEVWDYSKFKKGPSFSWKNAQIKN